MRGTKQDNVDCAVIRQAVADSGLSQGEVARRMGWTRVTTDTTKLRRSLGLEVSSGAGRVQKSVTYEKAVAMIQAMDLEPTDYGL